MNAASAATATSPAIDADVRQICRRTLVHVETVDWQTLVQERIATIDARLEAEIQREKAVCAGKGGPP
jgi:hypothetical protein